MALSLVQKRVSTSSDANLSTLLTFSALAYGTLSTIRNDIIAKRTPVDLVKTQLKSSAILLAFTSDEQSLLVYTEDNTLFLYTQDALKGASGPTKTLITSDTQNSNNVPVFGASSPLVGLLPRPQHSQQVALVNKSGVVTLFNIETGELKHVTSDASALSWSPQGKAFTIGTSGSSRSLSQYTHDGDKRQEYAIPDDLDSELEIASVTWVAAGKYIVALFDPEGRCVLCMVTTNKEDKSSTWLTTENASEPFGDEERTSSWYQALINNWGGSQFPYVLVTASAKSNDLAILTGDSIFDMQDESKRATLPFRTPESSPVGIALDFSSTETVPEPVKGIDECAPLPIVWILDNEGNVLAWNVFYTKGIKDESVKLSNIMENYNKTNQEASASRPETSSSTISNASAFGSAPVFGGTPSGASPFASNSPFALNKSNSTSSPFSGIGNKDGNSSSTLTDSKPAFGSSGFGQFGKSDSKTPAFGSSTFGSSTTDNKPAFGSSTFGSGTTDNKPAFGSSTFGSTNSDSKPAFGSTSFGSGTTNSTPAFGSTTFGSSTSDSKSSFGSTTFGSGTSDKPAFGSSTFGSNTGDKPTFGSSGFGASTGDKPAFGSSGFGSSTGDKSAFGSSTFGSSTGDNKTTFGSTSFGSTGEKPAFGSSSFGSKTDGKPTSSSSSFSNWGTDKSSPFSGTGDLAQNKTNSFSLSKHAEGNSTPQKTEEPKKESPSTFSQFGSSGQSAFGKSAFGASSDSAFPKSSSSPFASSPFAKHVDSTKTGNNSPNNSLFQNKTGTPSARGAANDDSKFEDSSDLEEEKSSGSEAESDGEVPTKSNAFDSGLGGLGLGEKPKPSLFSKHSAPSSQSSTTSLFANKQTLNANPFGQTAAFTTNTESKEASDSGSTTPTPFSKNEIPFPSIPKSSDKTPQSGKDPEPSTPSSKNSDSSPQFSAEKSPQKEVASEKSTDAAEHSKPEDTTQDSEEGSEDEDDYADEEEEKENEEGQDYEEDIDSEDEEDEEEEDGEEGEEQKQPESEEDLARFDDGVETERDASVERAPPAPQEPPAPPAPKVTYADSNMQFPDPDDYVEAPEEPTLSDYFYEHDDEEEPEIPSYSHTNIASYISLDAIEETQVGDTYEAEAVSIFKEINAQFEILRLNSKRISHFISMNQPEVDEEGYELEREFHSLADVNHIADWKLSESEDVGLILEPLSAQLSNVKELFKFDEGKELKALLIDSTAKLEQVKELILYHKGFLNDSSIRMGGLSPKAALLQKAVRSELKKVKELLGTLERNINVAKSQLTSSATSNSNRRVSLGGLQESIQKITHMAVTKSSEVDKLISRVQDLTVNGPNGSKLLENGTSQKLIGNSLQLGSHGNSEHKTLDVFTRGDALKDSERIDITEHQNRHELRTNIGKLLRSRVASQIANRQPIKVQGRCQ